jgi:hypothetical protein
LENVNCKSVLIYYLTYGGKGEPLYRFQPLQAFSQGLFSGSQNDSSWRNDCISEIYANAPEKFAWAMQLLGATPAAVSSGASSAWHLAALPKVPLEIRYYHQDDEFPCAIKLLVDRTALNYLPFETLAVYLGCVISELEHIGASRKC